MKSFHSYSSAFLFTKLFTKRFGYTETQEGTTENDNRLVVDVLVREMLPNLPPVSQTNNGEFLSVGTFSVDEEEYEMYMKCVDYSTLSDTRSTHKLSFTKEGSRLALLPTRLDSPYTFLAQVTNPSYITCTSEKSGKAEGPAYTLFSGDTQDEVIAKEGSLTIEDADHKQRIAFYVGTTLSARVDIENERQTCSTALCELLFNQKSLYQGTLCITPTEVIIYNETDLKVYRFACTMNNDTIATIEFEGEWYTFVGAVGHVNRRLMRTRFPPQTIARWRTGCLCEC